MGVSRENISPWSKLIDIVANTDSYKRLFVDRRGSAGHLPFGFLSLLLSTRVLKESSSLIIILDESLSERVYLSVFDLIPNLVFFAPSTQNTSVVENFFITENEKRFSGAYNYLVDPTRPGVVFISEPALEEMVRDPEDNVSIKYSFKTKKKLAFENLVRSLSLWGYEKESEVKTPKTFSIRGGILDIYPLYSKYPVRIELFGNIIDSIRFFNPASQLSIKSLHTYEIYAPSGFSKRNKIPLGELINKSFNEIVTLLELDGEFFLAHSEDLQTGSFSFKGEVPNKNINLRNKKIFVFSSGKSIGKNLKERLGNYFIIEKPLLSGFSLDETGVIVFGYSDLNIQRPVSVANENDHAMPYESFSLSNISWGELVVHENYGIGRYRGLSDRINNEEHQDSIVIEYADGGIVRVPIDRFDKIHKYISSNKDSVKLSSLGSKKWERQKRLVHQATREILDDLVALYSQKQQPRSFSYTRDDELVDFMSASFPFQETLDQRAAIHDILNDLNGSSPMDRVVFGDVGFGKTEVALRGAMKVISGGKQVFFLAPTTLLADQHYITSRERMGELGVSIALLSRFQTKKEQVKILTQIESKKVDLIVGTHRLLSEDVPINNLGMLIIDEEHRFGVRYKERLRILKKDIDVLTLTATPIPRTLQQSLFGVRDVSQINTPPLERLPIKTIVQFFDWASIKKIIKRELSRGGQVYFLHNDIQSIPFMVEKIRLMFPKNKTMGAHGSIPSKTLEKIILSFFNGDIDILVCTTIIESGLDVTRANTIIINNSHRLGLAQLYQIRGRVGRGNLQAYCWLLIPKKTLKKDAYERLRAIEHFCSLGSGYQIALKDLEIRGAGNLFGYEQSGNIGKVGYELYCKILLKSLDEKLKKVETKKEIRPRIIFKGPAFLPEDFIPLVQDRIYYYQRLASAKGVESVRVIENEIVDRFGQLIPEVKNVIFISVLRELFINKGVEKILLDSKKLLLIFNGENFNDQFNLLNLHKLFQNQGWEYFFKPLKQNKLSVSLKTTSLNESLEVIQKINSLLITLSLG